MKKQSGRFETGNKAGRGRPHGSRNKATIALQQLLDGHGESITKKCALLALQGDPTALRLCMERLIPPRREHPVKFKLLNVNTAADIVAALSDVLHDVARGQLTPSEGQMITLSLEIMLKALKTEVHENRLSALESGSEKAPENQNLIVLEDSDLKSEAPEKETDGQH